MTRFFPVGWSTRSAWPFMWATPRPASVCLEGWCCAGTAVTPGRAGRLLIHWGISRHHLHPLHLSSAPCIPLLPSTSPLRPWGIIVPPHSCPLPVDICSITTSKTEENNRMTEWEGYCVVTHSTEYFFTPLHIFGGFILALALPYNTIFDKTLDIIVRAWQTFEPKCRRDLKTWNCTLCCVTERPGGGSMSLQIITHLRKCFFWLCCNTHHRD